MLGYRAPRDSHIAHVLRGMEAHFVNESETYLPQEVSSMAWAFATMEHQGSPKTLAAMEAHAASGASDAYTATDVSNLAWAFATLGHQPSASFCEVAQAARA